MASWSLSSPSYCAFGIYDDGSSSCSGHLNVPGCLSRGWRTIKFVEGVRICQINFRCKLYPKPHPSGFQRKRVVLSNLIKIGPFSNLQISASMDHISGGIVPSPQRGKHIRGIYKPLLKAIKSCSFVSLLRVFYVVMSYVVVHHAVSQPLQTIQNLH